MFEKNCEFKKMIILNQDDDYLKININCKNVYQCEEATFEGFTYKKESF